MAYMIIDEIGQYPPGPTKDIFWEVGIPEELPYTIASLPFRGTAPPTSSCDVEVSLEGQQIIPITELQDSAKQVRPISFGPFLLPTHIKIWKIDCLSSAAPYFLFLKRI